MKNERNIRRRVLLVEDCEDFRTITVGFLKKRFQFELILASSGTEAIQILSNDADFDLVITDYQMPNGDGKDILNHINQLQIDVPVVIFSGGGYDDSLFKHPKTFYKVDKPAVEKLEQVVWEVLSSPSKKSTKN